MTTASTDRRAALMSLHTAANILSEAGQTLRDLADSDRAALDLYGEGYARDESATTNISKFAEAATAEMQRATVVLFAAVAKANQHGMRTYDGSYTTTSKENEQ